MKFLITENQKTKLLRRISHIDELVKYGFENIYTPDIICDSYENGEVLLDVIIEWVVERMYYKFFNNLDDSSDEWGRVYNLVVEYINDVYSDTIRNYYSNNCEN
jgi:hypothetical protein